MKRVFVWNSCKRGKFVHASGVRSKMASSDRFPLQEKHTNRDNLIEEHASSDDRIDIVKNNEQEETVTVKGESFVIDFDASHQKPKNLQDAFRKYKKKRQVSVFQFLDFAFHLQ